MAEARKVNTRVTKRSQSTEKKPKLSVKNPRTSKASAKSPLKSAVKSSVVKKKSPTKAELEKKAQGAINSLRGSLFERYVAAYYAKRGWHCTPDVKKFGHQIDIVGTKSGTFLNDDEILVVECKRGEKVTASEVLKFIALADRFNKTASVDIEAVIAYTGELPKDAEPAAKSSKTKIRFKRFDY